MSSKKGKRKRTPLEEHAEIIKCLIQECMSRNLFPEEVIDALYKQQKIEPSVTKTYMQGLEKHNKGYFTHYYMRLLLIELHNRQAQMTSQTNIPPIILERGASSVFLEDLSTKIKEELLMVKNLIEQCLVHYMSKLETMDILYHKESIDRFCTKLVWNRLEEQNQEFFKNYFFRLDVIYQAQKFNELVDEQAAMMNRLHQPNEAAAMMNQKFDIAATATTLDIDRHRLGTLGLHLQLPPGTDLPLHCSTYNQHTGSDNQHSGSGNQQSCSHNQQSGSGPS